MNENKTITALELERYVAGDLPDIETARISEAAETDAVLRKRIEALESSNREILAEQPPGWFADRVREKAEAEGLSGAPSSRRWLWAIPAVAAALLLMLRDPAVEQPPWDGIKGTTPHIVLYRAADDAPTRLADGARVSAGDRIQIVYQSAGKPWGAIFSVDGNAQVTRHFPERGNRSAELKTTGPDTLAFAYRLDDAPRLERFFFITGDAPFETDDIHAAAARTADGDASTELAIAAELGQHVMTLIKEPTR